MDQSVIPLADPIEGRDLRAAVEWRWSCSAELLQTVPVSVQLGGGRTWDVIVHIFDLLGCAKASRAYAWTVAAGADGEQRILSSLHIGPINTPSDAVGAAAADELRTKRLAMVRPHYQSQYQTQHRRNLFRSG
jgi:hypothetical protein